MPLLTPLFRDAAGCSIAVAGRRHCDTAMAARYAPCGPCLSAPVACCAVRPAHTMPAARGGRRKRAATLAASARRKAVGSSSDDGPQPAIPGGDVTKIFNLCHQLQDRVESMEAQLHQLESRGRDRAVALRAILRDDKQMDQLLGQHEDGQLELPEGEKAEPWDSYRNSFTLLISKGYLRTVEALHNRLMASEWELGHRPIALQLGVSRFEQYCAANKVDLPFEVISEVYEDPTDLRAIQDPHLRMHARSIINQAESEERVKAWVACTVEAQKLAERFSEAEFISRIIPDPLENGMIDAMRKLVMPLMSKS